MCSCVEGFSGSNCESECIRRKCIAFSLTMIWFYNTMYVSSIVQSPMVVILKVCVLK